MPIGIYIYIYIYRLHLDGHLRKYKNGFSSVRKTTSIILAPSLLIEGVKYNNLEAILIFIDFKKAFDTIEGNTYDTER